MKRPIFWFMVMVLALASACKSEATGSAPPDESAVAGKVIGLTGVVRAKSGADTRELAVDSEVKGADMIETGPGASVTIVLYHNNAQWSLGPDKQRKVSESVAWNAAWQAPLVAEKTEAARTAAAGRHAEREAADTRATALAESAKNEAAKEADLEGEDMEEGRDMTRRSAGRRDVGGKLERAPASAPAPMEEIANEMGGGGSSGAIEPSGSMKKGAAAPRAAKQDSLQLDEIVGGETSADADESSPPGGSPAPLATRSLAAVAPATVTLGATEIRPKADTKIQSAVRSALSERLAAVRRCLDDRKATHKGEAVAVVRIAIAKSGTGQASMVDKGTSADLAVCVQSGYGSFEVSGIKLQAGLQVTQTIVWRAE